MHQRYLAISLAAAMLCAAPGWAAVIYKWTDADGVVHFSDQPTPGAERIVTQSGPVSRPAGSAVSSSPRTAARRQPTKTEPNATAVDYTEFEIQAPQPE